jgi:hypothetical protein
VFLELLCCRDTDSRYGSALPLIHECLIVQPRRFVAPCAYNDGYRNAQARFPYVVNRQVTTTGKTTVALYCKRLRRSGPGEPPRSQPRRLPTPPPAVRPPKGRPLP